MSRTPPLADVTAGTDTCICRHCPHRGSGTKRTCCVNVGQALVNILKTCKKVTYRPITSYQEVLEDRVVRFGAYGDPAFIPDGVVARALTFAKGHTGYTHQWYQDFADDFRGVFMASVDSDLEEQTAQSQGWKTFRVFHPDAEISGSKICPASITEHHVQCMKCLLCNGKKTNIGIHAHGRAASQVGVVEEETALQL